MSDSLPIDFAKLDIVYVVLYRDERHIFDTRESAARWYTDKRSSTRDTISLWQMVKLVQRCTGK